MDACPICLDELSSEREIYTLTCGHHYHHECFKKLVFQTSHTYVTCPMCRSMNTKKPIVADTTEEARLELKKWFHQEKRCNHLTKKGTRCKKSSLFMNHGCCSVHSKDILPVSNYQVYASYLGYVLESTNHWNTKMYMLDIARKLLVKYPEIKTVQDIQHCFLEFFHKCRYEKMSYEDQSNPRVMYKYYQLTFPSKCWIKRCICIRSLI